MKLKKNVNLFKRSIAIFMVALLMAYHSLVFRQKKKKHMYGV